MAVSAVGANLNFDLIRRVAVGVVVGFVLFAYFFGPATAPLLRQSATARCNAYAAGDFRSYRLHWNVGLLPHWTCWDASRPERDPISLGWSPNPFR